MPNALLCTSRPNGYTTTAGETVYYVLAHTRLDPSTTETKKQITWRMSGTLSQLYVRITANSTSLTSTVRTRKNTANGNQAVSIAAGITGVFEDNINTDVITNGDRVNYQNVSSGTGTFTITIASVMLTTSTNANSVLSTDAGFIFDASTTRINVIMGELTGGSTVDAEQNTRIRRAGTFKNFGLNVDFNDRTTTTTFALRLNNVNTTTEVTIPASTSGLFEDSDTVSVIDGDEINLSFTSGSGAGSLFHEWCHSDFESSSGFIINGSSNGGVVAANLTRYIVCGGDLETLATAEADAQQNLRFPCVLSRFAVNVIPNTVTATSTARIRIHGANGNQSVSIPTSTTGVFVDEINTDRITSANLINFQITTGATGTSLTLRQMIVWTSEITTGVGVGTRLSVSTIPRLTHPPVMSDLLRRLGPGGSSIITC